ncbi:hypothetical protein INT47_001441 [Mucor saturninus]|uniref:Uncharacterized protein n=1 Tax=Mucor saturninus TaxID=64648 RepID=A0A8H7V2V5_9FUNG|nr:hypothetical protein INT47_001441 [Mucor saturninus]
MNEKNTIVNEEDICTQVQKDDLLIEKYLFYIGFVFPLAWFIGSTTRRYRHSSYIWKKRCRIAATLCLTLTIVSIAVVTVVNPQLFGLKSDIGAQTSSASNNAIRPGVPIIGTNDYGDTVAGIGIDDNV